MIKHKALRLIYYYELLSEISNVEGNIVECGVGSGLKKVKELYKEFGFTAGMLKGALAEGRKKK